MIAKRNLCLHCLLLQDISFDQYEVADAPTTFEGEILEQAADGNWYVEVKKIDPNAPAILIYEVPTIAENYNSKFTATANFFNEASASRTKTVTTTIKSSQIYFDEDKQTLNTKLSTMQNTLSSEMINEVAKNKTYTAKIESSNGTVLAETLNKNTTLTCNVKNANDVVNIDGTNYRTVWTRRTASGGTQDSAYNVISTSVSVAYTDISTDYIYICTVQKIENNQWHDVISAEITIVKNIYEVLKTEYYTKEESPKAILTILGETEISTVNGKENSIISTIQTTHETVDTFEKVIEKNNTTINDFVNKSASVYQNYDEFKTTVKKTYATNTKVDELANGNNLLRNSDTLIFDEYIIGSKLIDASNNILVDRNGYILVG